MLTRVRTSASDATNVIVHKMHALYSCIKRLGAMGMTSLAEYLSHIIYVTMKAIPKK